MKLSPNDKFYTIVVMQPGNELQSTPGSTGKRLTAPAKRLRKVETQDLTPETVPNARYRPPKMS
jgi:hypothetical protein